MFAHHDCKHTPPPPPQPQPPQKVVEKPQEPTKVPEKPKMFTVVVKGVTYTFNENSKLHSFDDRPAIKSYSMQFEDSNYPSKNRVYVYDQFQYHYTDGVINRAGSLPAIYEDYDITNVESRGTSYAFVVNGVANDPNHLTPAMYNRKSDISVMCNKGEMHGLVKFHKYGKEFEFDRGRQDAWDKHNNNYNKFLEQNRIKMPKNPCRDVKEFMELNVKGPARLRFFWQT
jgi:hypothetical protein